MSLQIVPVPAFNDNYIWLVHEHDTGETLAVDPGDAEATLEALQKHGWQLTQIWITHKHADHIGGVTALKAKTGARVSGPAKEAQVIKLLDILLHEGDVLAFGQAQAEVWEVPAHTLGHIAFHFHQEQVIFTGDTLFAGGCGRLFEGTLAQMFENMHRFAALPDDTQVYCAHEYTLSNVRFAHALDPSNEAVAARLQAVETLRARNEITLPTTIRLERATNPFMRAASLEELGQRRALKDRF